MTDMTTEQALEWLEGLRNTTGDQVCAEIEAGKAAEAAQAFRAALSRPAVPEGYKLVPVQPTEVMKAAGCRALGAIYGHYGAEQCWKAMLAAAPEPASAGVAGCYDCGLQYGGASWIEAVIPDKAWSLIRPEGAAEGCGILCISCIAKRLREHGIEHCPVWLCGTEPLRPFGQKDCADNLPVLRQWEPGQPSAEGDSE